MSASANANTQWVPNLLELDALMDEIIDNRDPEWQRKEAQLLKQEIEAEEKAEIERQRKSKIEWQRQRKEAQLLKQEIKAEKKQKLRDSAMQKWTGSASAEKRNC